LRKAHIVAECAEIQRPFRDPDGSRGLRNRLTNRWRRQMESPHTFSSSSKLSSQKRFDRFGTRLAHDAAWGFQ